MAGAAAVSPSIPLASTNRLSPPSPSPIYCSFPLRPLHHNFKTRIICRNPTLSVCHGKLNDSAGEEHEELDEAFFDREDVMEDESDEDDTESSLDLLFRFIQSMYRKVSKRARKASRSVLPDVISPQLVAFAVDGVLLLASLSIVKALLEVVCTLGGTVFVAILLLRVIWAAISYFQLSGNDLNNTGTSYSRTQPVT